MELETKNTTIPSQIVDIWQKIVDSISVLLDVPSVMINRLEPPELEVFRSNISPDNPLPSGTRMQMAGVYCEAAARRRQSVQVTDARKDPVWADSPTAKAGIFAYLGYPVFWPDGDVFGTICAVDTKENKWIKPSADLLHTFRDAIEAHLALVATMEELSRKNQELEHALHEVRTLQGLLPICASCKKIRDDQGYWNEIETYIGERSEAQFSHGICPDCVKKLYPDLDLEKLDK
jgi:GAF domain-containing protein